MKGAFFYLAVPGSHACDTFVDVDSLSLLHLTTIEMRERKAGKFVQNVQERRESTKPGDTHYTHVVTRKRSEGCIIHLLS